MDYFKLIYYGTLLLIFLGIFIIYMRGQEKEKSFVKQHAVQSEEKEETNYEQGYFRRKMGPG